MKDKITAHGYRTELYEIDGERHKRIALIYGDDREQSNRRRDLFMAALTLARRVGVGATEQIKRACARHDARQAEANTPKSELRSLTHEGRAALEQRLGIEFVPKMGCDTAEHAEQGAILGWFLAAILFLLAGLALWGWLR